MEESTHTDYVDLATVCCVLSKRSPFLSLPRKCSVRCRSPANCSSVLTVILKMVLILSLDSKWVLGKRLAV